MSFLSPAFLWGLPLAAIPVVIHLFHRRQRDAVRWGAMQFLFDDVSRRRRIWRVNDLFLMLMRVLAVMIFVAALARPVISSRWLPAAAGRDVVLIVDASLSTARVEEGRPVFEKIREGAGRLIGGLGDRDRLRVMLAANAPSWLLPIAVPATRENKDRILQRLAELHPTEATSDFLGCVRRAVAAESPEMQSSRLIAVICDGAEHGWSIDAGANWQSVKQAIEGSRHPIVVTVDAVSSRGLAEPNLALDRLQSGRRLVGIGESFSVTATVRNTGAGPSPEVPLEWIHAGSVLGLSTVPALAPGQTTEISYQHAFDQPGVYRIEGRLKSRDPLPADDTNRIVLEAVNELPVLIVAEDRERTDRRGALKHILAALGRKKGKTGDPSTSAGVFRPTVINYAQLGETTLSKFRAVLAIEPSHVSGESCRALESFVESGGGLWLVLGERTDPKPFNARLNAGGAGLSPAAIGTPVGDVAEDKTYDTIHPPAKSQPATAVLSDTQRIDIDSVRIYRRFPLSKNGPDDGAAVLLESGKGEPLAIERNRGSGRVIVQSFPLGLQWSNLPQCEAFVPIVHEWLWHLAEPTGTAWNLRAASPFIWTSAELKPETAVEVRTPLGDMVKLTPAIESERTVVRLSETEFPGNYLLRISGKDQATELPFQVERDPDESTVQMLDRDQRQRLVEMAGLQWTSDPFSISRLADVNPAPGWNILLWGLLGVFVVERLIAAVLSHRRVANSAATIVR